MILVTGGTGFVGREIVEHLLALGHHVRLLVRHPERAARFAHRPGVEIAIGDALEPETLGDAMNGVDAVVHSIGIIAETPRVSFEQAHIEATRNLLEAASYAGVTRWVQISALGTRAHAGSAYHRTKWEAEQLVRRSGLDWTIIRPSLIYGNDEHDRLLNALCAAFSAPLATLQCYSFPLLDGGEACVQPVNVRDVAHCAARSVSNEASIGQTIDLVGPVPLSWRDLFTTVARQLGHEPVYERAPVLLPLRALLWLSLLVVPIVLIILTVLKEIPPGVTVLGGFIWLGLVIFARRWTQLIFINVPSGPLWVLGETLAMTAPQGLRIGDQVQMAGEDNVGDPAPASALFDFQPEPFEVGVARIVAARRA